MTSHTTPFAAILESQPPVWRLRGGGAVVVVAYLGLLLGALTLGGRAVPPAAPKPRSKLVVTLVDHPAPIELPVKAAPALDHSAERALEEPRAAALATKPKLKPKEPAPTPTPPPPIAAKPITPAEITKPDTAAPVEVAAPSTSVVAPAHGSAAATPASMAGASSGTNTGSGTGTRTRTGTGGGTDVTVMAFADGMTRPKLLDMVPPEYTREARDANVKGVFLAKCVITTEGKLQKCRVVKGLPMMDQAVLSALARWRYSPVIYQGRPVAVDYVIQVRLAGP